MSISDYSDGSTGLIFYDKLDIVRNRLHRVHKQRPNTNQTSTYFLKGNFVKFNIFLTITIIHMTLFPLLCTAAPSADNIFFYRASYFPGTTRFHSSLLSTVEIMAGGGSTTHARNDDGKKITLRTHHGDHDCESIFSIAEAFFGFTQNIIQYNGDMFGLMQDSPRGIFLYVLLPLRSLKLHSIYHVNSASSQDSIPLTCQQGMGDASFYIGWTINYEETQELDFIDATVKVGVLAPTALSQACQFSLGNDGHIGIPITFDGALGMYDWLTIGCHASAVPFLDKKRNLYTCDSSDNIVLNQAQVHRGPQWLAAVYLEADHFFRGFSLILGYSYAKKEDDCARFCGKQRPLSCAAPTGTCFVTTWSMHTINLSLDYDFARPFATTGLRLGAFCNVNVGGKNILTTPVGGGTLGIDASWSFN
jgi:hypothetical protein